MAGQQKYRQEVTGSEIKPVLRREKSGKKKIKMGLIRVLRRKLNREVREWLGRQKEIWDNISPSLHLKF